MAERPEDRAVVTGVGRSEVGRRLPRSELDLTVEACLAAITDAGLTRDDIDGLATTPGGGFDMPGLAGPGTPDVQTTMGLDLNWTFGGPESGQLGAFFSAVLAVATGLCRHALVYRTLNEATAQGAAGRGATVTFGVDAGGTAGFRKWFSPFDALSPASWVALYAQRHMHTYGTTKEQLGWVALNARRNAGRNPWAIYREPLTMDAYLGARLISTPFGLYDCDVPCDGSVAFVVSAADHAPDSPRPPLRIEAMGWAIRHRPSWDQWGDFTTMAAHDVAAHLWSRTSLRPSDVDVAELYDGFSFLSLLWLEAMGFCGPGEGGPFVEGGKRIALEGELPLNTQGGQLSAGRLHGSGLLHEACVQLWGLGEDRQVPGAGGRPVEVAAVGVGGGPTAGAVLLTRS